MAISQSIKRACRRYEEVEADGLTLYPILVEELEAFELARPGIDIVQQALPVRYAAMPLLSAYRAMDVEAAERGEEPLGLFTRALAFLALALRVGEGQEISERIRRFRIKVDAEDPAVVKAIVFSQDGEEKKTITPVQFQRLRYILAAQNGIELADETANPELLEAQAELDRQNAPKLKRDAGTLISAVAAFSGCGEDEIDEWPILKLMKRKEAYQRAADYILCGMAAAQGAKWKNGNPVPDLFYEREREENGALMPLSHFTKT